MIKLYKKIVNFLKWHYKIKDGIKWSHETSFYKCKFL